MDSNLTHTLDEGVAAQHLGDISRAESCYRVVLDARPNHAEANHNLGLIALSVNQTKAALSLIQGALDENPGERQFWLSYIYTLWQDDQIENAKVAIDSAKKMGSGSKR